MICDDNLLHHSQVVGQSRLYFERFNYLRNVVCARPQSDNGLNGFAQEAVPITSEALSVVIEEVDVQGALTLEAIETKVVSEEGVAVKIKLGVEPLVGHFE